MMSLVFHVDVRVWWLPWAYEDGWQELLSLGCLSNGQYGKAGLAFQLVRLLCLKRHTF